MTKSKPSESVQALVHAGVIKSFGITGARVLFPYYTDKNGAYKYACLDVADMLSILRWDVDAEGKPAKTKKV